MVNKDEASACLSKFSQLVTETLSAVREYMSVSEGGLKTETNFTNSPV